MKISINTLKYINEHYHSAGHPAPRGVQALVEQIGAQLGAVEEVVPFGKRFEGVVVARVVSCEKHPNADKLHVCRIDDGGIVREVQRDENGNVQVVCGAPNVREGLRVAWLPPGATVPSTFDKDPFVLEARELRGELSNGMLASPRELSLSDDHDGIMEITENIAPGTLLTQALHLGDDYIIDIENKMFTHRPDCFGWLGVAREIEGIAHRPYKSPEWYRLDPVFPELQAEPLPLEVRNEVPNLVPRFVAVAMRDVQVGPSPLWLQANLVRVGLRPINNIVDYTNYYMSLTGQPLHAYDYDKVKALSDSDKATLVVRHPHKDETLKLLNGKQITPRDGAIMIATNKQLIGVGGVMGGADTEVDEHTKNIIIEVANFDMYSIRRTSMEHGLFTDAVARFNKGQSPLQNLAVAAKIVDQITKNGHGVIASPVIDDNHLPQFVLERGSVHQPVVVSRQFINERLGSNLGTVDMAGLLANIEFAVQVNGDDLTVQAPFWRTDIEIPEDIVEEVGRLYGYDQLPMQLPTRDIAPTSKNPVRELKRSVRSRLGAAGANELLTYTFVHGNLIDKVGQKRELAFQLSNALSPDLQYFRLSLTPSLLEKVHPNLKADADQAGDNEFALFEINKVHNQQAKNADEGLPKELPNLALVFAADAKTAARKYSGAPFYQAKKYLTYLLGEELAGFVRFVPLDQADLYDNQWAIQMAAPFEPKRSAALMDANNLVWGVVGEYRAAVKKALKLPDFAAGFEVDAVLFMNSTGHTYAPLLKFPHTSADMSFQVAAHITYQELYAVVQQQIAAAQAAHGYVASLSPVDVYRPSDHAKHYNITLRLELAHPERTLRTDDVNAVVAQIAAAANQTLKAEKL
jgi:phenylalanyl-tRNA synthetase beta chain